MAYWCFIICRIRKLSALVQMALIISFSADTHRPYLVSSARFDFSSFSFWPASAYFLSFGFSIFLARCHAVVCLAFIALSQHIYFSAEGYGLIDFHLPPLHFARSDADTPPCLLHEELELRISRQSSYLSDTVTIRRSAVYWRSSGVDQIVPMRVEPTLKPRRVSQYFYGHQLSEQQASSARIIFRLSRVLTFQAFSFIHYASLSAVIA